MKILAVLQNQWFRDPEGVKRMLARHDDNPAMRERVRRRLISMALFAGCKTGRVLQKCLGEELCDAIKWEEASPEIVGRASSCFPADRAHLAGLFPTERLLAVPHPAARQADVIVQIRALRPRLEAARAVA